MALAAFFFIFGAVVASFIGVIVARLHTGASIVSGRSCCDSCGTPLPPLSLIPIFSFFMLRRRARCCGARLSFIPPLSEFFLGLLFMLSYLRFGFGWSLISFLSALALLLALVLYDFAHQILPPFLLILFMAASALAGFFLASSLSEFLSSAFSAFLRALFIVVIHLLSRGRAMGFADAPLTFALGLLTGSAAFPGFIFSFWIGAGIGIIILLMRPAKTKMGIEVPFAPFLAAGFLLAFFTQWNPFALIVAMP